jgi:hypothetical protein
MSTVIHNQPPHPLALTFMAMPQALRNLIPKIDAYGFPASELLCSFLPDGEPSDGGAQARRMFALVDRCLSSWIDQMTLVESVEGGNPDDPWSNLSQERKQALARLQRLRCHMRQEARMVVPDALGD